MNHVDDQVLAALALEDTADLPADEVASAQAHLAGCDHCSTEVSQLRETFALVRDSRDEALVAPPPSVWAAISAEIAREGSAAPAPAAPATPHDVPAAPSDLGAPSDLAAPAGLSAPTDLDERRRRRGGVPTWLASSAAAVALLVGLGGGYLLSGEPGEEPAPSATVVASAELASLDAAAEDRGTAEVRRQDDRVVLHVEADDLAGPEGVREVWLINLDGTRMVSLGLLASGESGDFEFPERLLDEGYRIVDISYEPDDGDPTHSGESLARGTIEG